MENFHTSLEFFIFFFFVVFVNKKLKKNSCQNTIPILKSALKFRSNISLIFLKIRISGHKHVFHFFLKFLTDALTNRLKECIAAAKFTMKKFVGLFFKGPDDGCRFS